MRNLLLPMLLASPAFTSQGPSPGSAARPEPWPIPHARPAPAPSSSPGASFEARRPDRSTVHWDEVDGAVWTRGASYKARFDGDGLEFVPFFGSSAPRNFPVRFTLLEATVRGEPLPLRRVATARRAGDQVRIERGALTEVYAVRPASVEQTFVFQGLPPGELRVRVGVETELLAAEGAGGLELRGARGHVGYGRAFLVDGYGRRSALESDYSSGAIEIRVPAALLAASPWPVTIDPVIATFPIDVFPVELGSPDAAYDAATDSFLVAYEEAFSVADADVYSTRLDAAGGFLDGQYVDMTSAEWILPSVANNTGAGQFLVACLTGGYHAVHGRLRDAASTVYGAPFEISGGEPGFKRSVEVGGDAFPGPGSYYCVAWSRQLSATDNDVHARLVAPDGSLLGPGTMLIADGAPNDQGVAVSRTNGGGDFDTSAWAIAWRREDGGTCDLWAAEVLWTGFVQRPAYRVLDASYCVISVDVSSPLDGPGDRTYLFTHDRDFGSDHDVYANVVRGGSVVTQVNLSALEGSFAHTQRIAEADSDGLRFLVTYQQEYNTGPIEIYAATLNLLDDELCLTEGRVPVSTDGDELFVSVTSTRANGGPPASPSQGAREYLLVWEDRTAAPSHIDGALFRIDTSCVGDSYCGSELNSASVRARLDADGSLVAGAPLLLVASHMPATQFGYFLASRGSGLLSPPGSAGNLCLALPIARFSGTVLSSGPGGRFWTTIDTSSVPMSPPVSVLAGEEWHFQAWFRDGATSNFTNGLTVTFL